MTEERIDPGQDVLDSTGEKIGTVAYVVVHPPELHITDIVVSTGAILGRDVVVPIDEVASMDGGEVRLSIDKQALAGHEDYVEVRYAAPPEGWVAPTGLAYPTGALLWPVDTYYPENASVTVNAPSGTVGLRAGQTVESRDGHKIGTIDGLESDPESGDVTEIIVKEGFLFHHDVRIPRSAIEATHEDRVTLNVTKDEAEAQFGAEG